jgi:cobalt-zinc-cadmium efflux system outer membrane protein
MCSIAALCVVAPAQVPTTIASDRASLTFRDAVDRAIASNPQLQAEARLIDAAEARRVQAGLRPNPELSLELENLALTSPDDRESAVSLLPSIGWSESTSSGGGFLDEVEATLRVSYPMEMGHKRAKRVVAAAEQKDLAQWDYEIARVSLVRDVATTFVQLLTAQERESIHARYAETLAESADAVGVQVQAGEVSPLEHRRASVDLAAADLSSDQARQAAANARHELAAYWGGGADELVTATGELTPLAPIPTWESLHARMAGSPHVMRWAQAVQAQAAEVGVARSQRVPDVTATLGLRATGTRDERSRTMGFGGEGLEYGRSRVRSEEDAAYGVVLEFSLPLPLFDRNQGGIGEAEAMMARAELQQQAAEIDVAATMSRAWRDAAQASAAVARLDEIVLAETERILEDTRFGYTAGKFTYLELLEAERRWLEARLQYWYYVEQYHRAAIDIEWMLNASLVHPWPETQDAVEGDSGHGEPETKGRTP